MSLGRAIAERDPGLLPSRRDENWRWTDLRGLLREIPPASPAAGSPATAGPFAGLADETIEIVNGRGGGRPVLVGAGEQRTIALRLVSAEGAGSHVSELSIRVESGGRLVLLESHQGAGPGYVTAFALDLEVGEGAAAERVLIADDHPDGVNAVIARVSLARGAEFGQTTLTTGARRQRLETRVIHRGETSAVRLDGLYQLGGRTHADLTTVVTHEAVNCVTSQLTKGVADDQGRGVFQGRIVVSPGADGADARMGHHALILSDRAEIDAKPELEIWADDVACAHGNTVGALDEEALFYARQRGIPEAEARGMLTGAFLGEVIARIGYEGARDVARAWLATRLEGRRHEL